MSNFRRYYIQNGIVFVTMVTYNREPILIKHIELLRESLKSIKYHFTIIAGIVMPNHLHLLIQVHNSNEYPKIITSFKSYFSRNMPKNYNQTMAQIKRREKGIWQRKYYDHLIRDENDLNKHIDYIHYNSLKHMNINPCDWEYSTFKLFVENGYYQSDWCNFRDKNNIIGLDLE